MSDSEEEIDCAICGEEFTKGARSKRTQITCPGCETDICKECVRTYLLLPSTTKARCANEGCKCEWSKQFLAEHIGRTFVNTEWQNHLKSILHGQLKATMPQAMPRVAATRDVKKLNAEKYRLRDEIATCTTLQKKTKDKEEKAKLKEHKSALADKYAEVYQKWQDARAVATGNAGTTEKKQFIQPCRVNGCKGFLSKGWKCGICDTHCCAKCFGVKGKTKAEKEEHECKKEDIESAKMIRKETKPCPKCGTPIFKTLGCDQMCCMNLVAGNPCLTLFSWQTGAVETGPGHNPHFVEWMRENGQLVRNAGDQHCGGVPGIPFFQREINESVKNKKLTVGSSTDEFMDYFNYFHRTLMEINQYQVNQLRRILQTPVSYIDYQVKFLMDEMTEKNLLIQARRRDKAQEKNREVLGVYETISHVLTERLLDLYNNFDDEHLVTNITYLQQFMDRENLCLAEISNFYNQIVPFYMESKGRVNIAVKTVKQLNEFKKTSGMSAIIDFDKKKALQLKKREELRLRRTQKIAGGGGGGSKDSK